MSVSAHDPFGTPVWNVLCVQGNLRRIYLKTKKCFFFFLFFTCILGAGGGGLDQESVKVRGQLSGVNSFFLPCGSWGPNRPLALKVMFVTF